jgi:GNAT superfamily N-acetyltransferase
LRRVSPDTARAATCTASCPPPPLADKATADVFPCDYPPGHRLILREAARPVAEALVSVAPDHRATVCWIETQSPHRRRGLGRNLLGQALALLAEQGATEVALTLEDAPHTDVARAAHRLFASFGFNTVDQLWTYQRRPGTTQPTR